MKKFSAKSIIALLLLFVSPYISAQYQDFRSWWNFELSGEITKDLKAGVNLGQRFKENSLHYDRSLLTVSLEYEVLKNLSFDLGYRYIVLYDRQEGIKSKYRFHGGASYKIKFSSFSLDFRERIQYGFSDLSTVESYYMNKLTNRNRLNLSYDIFGTPLSLHSSYEFFLELNSQYGLLHSANRFKAGVGIDLPGKGDLDISYMFENELNTVNPLLSHILLLSYSYSL